MRLLFVDDNPYLPQTHGGVEWNTHELCCALPAHGVEVAVMAPIGLHGFTGLANRLRRRAGLWGSWPADHGQGYLVFRGWNVAEGLVEVARRWRPDRVVVQGSTPAYALRAHTLGLRTWFYFHHVLSALPGSDQLLGRVGFIASSPFLALRHAELYGVMSEVVRPLVRRERCATAVEPKEALFFSLQPAKGADVVIDLARARPDVPFTLVETWTVDTQATARLRAEALALPNVTIGRRHADVRRFFARARILLAPSRYEESWGRVVTEAHLNGIPVLTSGRGNLLDTVSEGGVCLDPDGDLPDAWQRALDRFWDDAAYFRCMADAARRAAARPELREDAIVGALLRTLDAVPRAAAMRSVSTTFREDPTL